MIAVYCFGEPTFWSINSFEFIFNEMCSRRDEFETDIYAIESQFRRKVRILYSEQLVQMLNTISFFNRNIQSRQ